MNTKYYVSFWSDIKNSLIFSQCKDEDDMNIRYEALLLKGRTCVMKYKGSLPHER